MVEAPAAVGLIPVTRPVAPPGVELLVFRHVMAHQVGPSAALAHGIEAFGFHWRVADDLQKLLVRPHVVFQRRDIEVADQDRRRSGAMLGPKLLHLLDELQLVGEFRIDRRVRLVAARRHVEVLDGDRLAADSHGRADVPAILDIAPGARHLLGQRQARDRRHAVISLLAVDRDVLVPRLAEDRERKQVVRTFGFLQAQHVRRVFGEEPLDQRHAQPHGIDVPGCDGKGHGAKGRLSRMRGCGNAGSAQNVSSRRRRPS